MGNNVAQKRSAIWWALAGGIALGSLAVGVAIRGEHETSMPSPSGALDPPGGEPPFAKKTLPPEPDPVSSQKPEATSRPQASVDEPEPECSHSTECRTAKQPDCVVPSCTAGKCVYDRSTCECISNEDCDDAVDCTRDICFANTKKCIHIRSACD